MNSTWDIPIGHERAYGSRRCRLGRRDRRRVDRVDDLPGTLRTQPDAVLRLGDTDPIYPANTGAGLDGVGQFGESWRPDVSGDPNSGGSRERFFDMTAFKLPADGTLGNAKKGSVQGAGHLDRQLRVLQGRRPHARRHAVEFTAMLDNAFNHPQFFVPGWAPAGSWISPTYLLDGDADNGTTGVLDADIVGSSEGFAVGRVIRLGLRLRF